MAPPIEGRHIHITGIVQGVGFRPFVYGLATRLALNGWVLNNSSGVEVEVAGPPAQLDAFIAALQTETPPLAVIDSLRVEPISNLQPPTFEIRHSQAQPHAFVPISPDICICDDCRRELFDPADRRYRYPFINCTNCGPRFTIIRDIPYDRPLTTMADFPMCPACQSEYNNPLDRRFHAQPNACPDCGPQVELRTSDAKEPLPGEAAIRGAQNMLAAGKIVAIKGLGGFHLACDATNDRALQTLRERKGRVDKPFAVMALDMDAVRRIARVDPAERSLLLSKERPIVLLKKRDDSPLSELVAPGNRYVGVMLPYTPLHYLLLTRRLPVLVMTSGNYSEEPIVKDNAEALDRLAPLADAFLLHNRDIHLHCDDSVVRVFEGRELPVRRSRGYAPFPVKLPFETTQILAVGGELKSAFCLTKGRYAFMSQHIGDMENLETLQAFEAAAAHFQAIFRVEPDIIACDMHPGYLSSKW
ncbi:MAG: carbamoyltransferase HypF, partial [Anaerolineae bacterium]